MEVLKTSKIFPTPSGDNIQKLCMFLLPITVHAVSLSILFWLPLNTFSHEHLARTHHEKKGEGVENNMPKGEILSQGLWHHGRCLIRMNFGSK